MTRTRRWAPRLTVVVAALAILLTGLVVAGTSPTARADGCKGGVICGRAVNKTSRTMKVAVLETSGNKRCGPVWDWWEDKWVTDAKSKGKGKKGDTACSTRSLKPDQSSKYFNYDIDAFTFDRKFWFMGKEYSGGTWVKFPTGFTAICRKLNPFGDSMPRCYLGAF